MEPPCGIFAFVQQRHDLVSKKMVRRQIFVEWTVEVKKKVQKQVEKLPKNVKKTLATLLKEIKTYGPYRIGWPNYGPLSKNRYHCHLKKGRPTYVAVWEIKDKQVRLVEVSYAGTHEKAPYGA